MAVLDIVVWPSKVLETRATEVDVFDDRLKTFVQDMHDTMNHARGIGLAANQVADLRRILVMHIPWSDEDAEEGEQKAWWHDRAFTFVNPIITKSSGKTKYQEGCLSFPGIYDWVERFDKITVKAQDEQGKEFEIEADGLLSICLQHEIDHLDGVVFFRRMSRLKARLIKQEMTKRSTARMETVEG